jgi:hypothetical protein
MYERPRPPILDYKAADKPKPLWELPLRLNPRVARITLGISAAIAIIGLVCFALSSGSAADATSLTLRVIFALACVALGLTFRIFQTWWRR